MKQLLMEHRYVFTWGHEDMPEIDLAIIEHHLCMDPKAKKVKQKCRSFNAEKCVVIVEEVDCLLAGSFEKHTIRTGYPTSCW